MPTAEQLARLLAIREAAASRALDGETMHVAAPDGGCCLEHARERIAELEAEATRLRSRVARLEGVLREVEWSGDTGDDRWNSCPYCEGHQPDHAPDCALDAALRDAHGE